MEKDFLEVIESEIPKDCVLNLCRSSGQLEESGD